MNLRNVIFTVVASLVSLSVANVAVAADSETAIPTCEDLEFTQRILDVLPEANAVCLGVTERDDRLYAEFQAEVINVHRGEVRVRFKRANGSLTDVHGFTPGRDARVKIAGKNYRYSQLARGQQLNVYLPPDRFEVAIAEDDDIATPHLGMITVAVLYRSEPAVAALPTTAGPLPLIGLFGGLLTVFGGSMFLIRRKYSN